MRDAHPTAPYNWIYLTDLLQQECGRVVEHLDGKGVLGLEQIGREFDLIKYSSVSGIVTRTEKQLLKNTQLRKRIEDIRQKLNKGQAKI